MNEFFKDLSVKTLQNFCAEHKENMLLNRNLTILHQKKKKKSRIYSGDAEQQNRLRNERPALIKYPDIS